MARLHPTDAIGQLADHDGQVSGHPHEVKAGRWLTPRQAMQEIPCPSLGALRAWCKRHRIVRGLSNSIDRGDIERIRKDKRKRRPRVMHPRSLANLVRVAGR